MKSCSCCACLHKNCIYHFFLLTEFRILGILTISKRQIYPAAQAAIISCFFCAGNEPDGNVCIPIRRIPRQQDSRRCRKGGRKQEHTDSLAKSKRKEEKRMSQATERIHELVDRLNQFVLLSPNRFQIVILSVSRAITGDCPNCGTTHGCCCS